MTSLPKLRSPWFKETFENNVRKVRAPSSLKTGGPTPKALENAGSERSVTGKV